MPLKVFLSGGLEEYNWQNDVISNLGRQDFVFFNPRDHLLSRAKEYTIWDLFYIQNCDVIFAYMQKENPSGFGLTLEIGYAAALGKLIILVDEKSSSDEFFQRKFKIVHETSSIVFEKFNDGLTFLKNLRNGATSL